MILASLLSALLEIQAVYILEICSWNVLCLVCPKSDHSLLISANLLWIAEPYHMSHTHSYIYINATLLH